MAEEQDFNPLESGRRIARAYLSKIGWAGEWRRSLNTQLYPAVLREEFETKERQCDQLEEEAETFFSSEYERWRKNDSPDALEVLRGIYEILGKRTDLGFFGKRIVERIKTQLFPL